MPDILSAALRALSFMLLLQAAGVALFLALFSELLLDSGPCIRRLGQRSAVLSLAVVAGHFALEAPRMAGDMAGFWDLSLHEAAFRSTVGGSFGLKVIGLAVVAVGLGRDACRVRIPANGSYRGPS